MKNGENHNDITDIINVAQAFSTLYNINCLVMDSDMKLCYHNYPNGTRCTLCNYLQKRFGKRYNKDSDFMKISCQRAEQVASWYIYVCPVGLHYFTVPIISGGKAGAYIICGPVILRSPYDRTLFDALKRRNTPMHLRNDIFDLMIPFPFLRLKDLEELARKLQIATTCLIETEVPQPMPALILSISQLDNTFSLKRQFSKNEMIHAFIKQDYVKTNKALIDMLNKIYIESHGVMSEICARILELVIIFTQNALSCGCALNVLNNTSYEMVQLIYASNNFYVLAAWLIKTVNSYFEHFRIFKDASHAQFAYKAIRYVDRNYNKKLTLDEIAGHVYLSPTYFSKVFHHDIQCNFNTYLNYIRIEKSRIKTAVS